MNVLMILYTFIFLTFNSGEKSIEKSKVSIDNQPFTFIELFTSQGCSSCPAADDLLSKTIDQNRNNSSLIAISYHVDYWNRLGWKDLLSKKEFSDRQRNYGNVMNLNSIYTPQMIVNGEYEFVGSNANELNYAIRHTQKNKEKVVFKNLSAIINGRNVTTEFEIYGDYKDSKVCVALISKKEETIIYNGENKGKTLINRNVVRYFHDLNADEMGKITFNTNIDLPLVKENFFIVAFVQNNTSLKITGAKSYEF